MRTCRLSLPAKIASVVVLLILLALLLVYMFSSSSPPSLPQHIGTVSPPYYPNFPSSSAIYPPGSMSVSSGGYPGYPQHSPYAPGQYPYPPGAEQYLQQDVMQQQQLQQQQLYLQQRQQQQLAEQFIRHQQHEATGGPPPSSPQSPPSPSSPIGLPPHREVPSSGSRKPELKDVSESILLSNAEVYCVFESQVTPAAMCR